MLRLLKRLTTRRPTRMLRLLMTLTTEDRWTIKRAFLLRIKKRLDREGIEIPFQYLTVITRNEES